jgi:glutamine synthetase
MSEMGLYYIGGILKHAPALLAITNPTTNSYKRLVPGYEAPVNLAYSQGNRSASVRIPLSGDNPKAKRLEFRCPDATSNPYLAFAAMLCAGIDGIKNKIHPGEPLDKNIYELSPEELSKIPSTPGSLELALQDFIENWIDYKVANEVKQMQLRPHPYEFFLYYDC